MEKLHIILYSIIFLTIIAWMFFDYKKREYNLNTLLKIKREQNTKQIKEQEEMITENNDQDIKAQDIIKRVLKGLWKSFLFLIKAIVIITIFFVYINSDNKKEQEWIGFIYPDKNNLWNDIEIGTFSNLESCRNSARSSLDNINSTYSGTYECALDCDRSRGKPYICKETKR